MFARDLGNYYRGKTVLAHKFNFYRRILRNFTYILRSRWLATSFFLLSLFILFYIFFQKPNFEKDEDRWNQAQSTYEKKQYAKSLDYLQRIRKKRLFPKIAKLRDKIQKEICQLERQIRRNFAEEKYTLVLKNILLLPVPSKEMIKLQILAQSCLKNPEEMRLSLARLRDMSPNLLELNFMGRKALEWGYFQDAYRYFYHGWKKAPKNTKIKFNFQASLARSLLYMGKDAGAWKLYKTFRGARSPENLLDFATLAMYREEYSLALSYLDRIKNVSPSIIVRHHLLQIYIFWRMETRNLCRWRWLYPRYRKKVFPELTEKIRAKLTFMGEKLKTIRGKLKFCPQNYLSRMWEKKLNLYTKALLLETSLVPVDRVEKYDREFSHFLKNHFFSPRLELFAKGVLIRFLIRHKRWKKVAQLCDSTLHNFPWAKNLYMLRGIARIETNEEGVNDDFLRSLQLQRFNFGVLENVGELLVRKMTQQEFYQFSFLLFRYLYGLEMNFSDLVFQKMQSNLRYHLKYSKRQKNSIKKISWTSLLHTALKNESAATRNLAIEILVSYSNSELQCRLKNLSARYSKDFIYKKRLEKIQASMKKHSLRKQKQILMRNLLRYRVFGDERYAKEVLGIENHLTLLKQILSDSEEFPMVRMLAAKMMMALKNYDICCYLSEVALGKSYPENLLAAIAIRSSGVGCPLPKNIEKKVLFTESNRFYRILLALHVNPYLDKNLHKQCSYAFLQSEDELLSLCTCYNLRCYEQLDKKLKRKLQKRLIQLSFSEDLFIRSLALRVSWRIRDLAQDIHLDWAKNYSCKKFFSPRLIAIEQIKRKYWFNTFRQKALLAALRSDESHIVQLGGLYSLMEDPLLRKFIAQDLAKDNLFLNQLLKRVNTLYQKSSNSMVRYWSIFIISILDRSNRDLSLHLKIQTFPLLLRASALLGRLLQERISTDAFKLFNVKDINPKTEQERRRAQLSLLITGYIRNIVLNTSKASYSKRQFARMFQFIMPSLLSKLIKALKSKDPAIVRSALTGLLWMGSVKDIDELYPYLKSPHLHIQRASAATIAFLTLKYRPDKFLQLQEILLEMPLQVRKSAAYGYYNIIRAYMVFRAEEHGHRTSELAYRRYLEYFEKNFSKQSPKKLKLWLLALKSADTLYPCVRYRYERALLLRYLKNFERADLQIQKALDIIQTSEKKHFVNYDRFRCLLLRAKLYFEKEQYRKALSYLKVCFVEYPFDAESYLLFARVLNRLGKKGVERALYTSYFCSPNFSKAWFALISYKLKHKGIVDTLKLDQYSSLNWKSANIEAQKSFPYFRKKLYTNSNSAKKMLKKRYPFVSEFHYEFATYLWKNRNQAAKKYFLYSYLSNPTKARPLWKFARILAKEGDDQAIAVLKYIAVKFSLPKKQLKKRICKSKYFLRLKSKWLQSLQK